MSARRLLRTLSLPILLLTVFLGSIRAADLSGTGDRVAPKVPVVEGPEVWKDAAQPINAQG